MSLANVAAAENSVRGLVATMTLPPQFLFHKLISWARDFAAAESKTNGQVDPPTNSAVHGFGSEIFALLLEANDSVLEYDLTKGKERDSTFAAAGKPYCDVVMTKSNQCSGARGLPNWTNLQVGFQCCLTQRAVQGCACYIEIPKGDISQTCIRSSAFGEVLKRPFGNEFGATVGIYGMG